MEPNKATSISAVHLRQMQNISMPQHFIVEVLFVDQKHDSLSSLLYQLRNEVVLKELGVDSRGLVYLPADAFVLMGEIKSVDKQKKIVYLANQNSVAYRHLIIACGDKTHRPTALRDEDFCFGVQALVDAIKIQKNAPSTISTPLGSFSYEPLKKITNCTLIKVTVASLRASLPKNIEKVAHHTISQEDEARYSALGVSDKLLFEVQI